jgi:hypothetical protein
MTQIVAKTEAVQDLEAAQGGKIEIEKDGDKFSGRKRARIAGEEVEGFAPVRDKFNLGVHAALAELVQEQFAIVGIVFHDEDADGLGRGAHKIEEGLMDGIMARWEEGLTATARG